MEEIAGNDKESKLLQLLKQQNETIQKLKAELKEKEILIKSLQQERAVQSESGGVGTQNKLLEVEEDKNSDLEPMEIDLTKYEKSENQSKKENEERGQVNEPANSDNNSAQTEALRNPLILTNILKQIRTNDLIRNCRLVNREWRDLSTDIILKRKNVQVKLVQDNSKMRLSNYQCQKLALEKTLDELPSILNISTRFPCVNFSFWGDLKLDDAQAFLSEFGSIIKGLTIRGDQDMKFLRKLFLEQVPNLENLVLYVVKVKGKLFSKMSPAPKLSSLMTLKLKMGNSSSLVKEILLAASNLQTCTGYLSVKQIELLIPRINIVKGLILEPEANNIDALEKLTKMKLQLKSFTMNYNYLYVPDEDPGSEPEKELLAKFDRINSKLLSLNRVTLQKIQISPDAFVDSVIEWPKLVNVVKLTISGNDNCVLKCPSFKISEKIPKLHTLCIKYTGNWEDQKDDTECPDLLKNVAPSVKVLSVDGECVKTFPQYYDKFPNVQHLSLDQIEHKDFPLIASAIWSMKKLKSLKLEFFSCSTSQIDAGFTGMERGTCRFLRNSGQIKPEVEEMEKYRVNPSILNLTDLEELHLPNGFQQEPDENEAYDEEDKEMDIASFVSFKFAFNLLPQLRVLSFWDDL